jgi:hypothetical protein
MPTNIVNIAEWMDFFITPPQKLRAITGPA